MSFDYSSYYRNMVKIPFWICIIILLLFVINIIFWFSRPKLFRVSTEYPFVKLLITSLIFLVIFYVNFRNFNYNYYIDRNETPINTIGVIEDIDSISFSSNFYYNGEVVSPKNITINGERYFILTIGEYNVGDNVTIYYLPNSNVVTQIKYNTE